MVFLAFQTRLYVMVNSCSAYILCECVTMKIVFIASECTPYVKTGGLADVVGALPRALQALGHEVVVILPRYAAIDGSRFGLEPFLSPMGVWMGNAEEWCAVQVAVAEC